MPMPPERHSRESMPSTPIGGGNPGAVGTARSEVSTPWRGYREIPPRLNIADEALERPVAAGHGERTAMVWRGGSVSYRELRARVHGFARGLAELGVSAGDRMLVQMPNSLEFATAFLAAVKLGALPVVVNSLLGVREVRAILEQTTPKVAVTEGSRAQALRDLREPMGLHTVVCAGEALGSEVPFERVISRSPDDMAARDTSAHEPAFMVCTSGTTGRPKCIVHAHRWIVALGDLNRYRLPPEAGDVVMATGEWSFISALGHNLLFALRNGVACAVLSGRATPENVLEHVQELGVTLLHSVATVYRRMLAAEGMEGSYDIHTLRGAHSTGEALREATYREWKARFGCEMYEHYGVSEYQLVVGQGARHPVKPGSVGVPAPDVGIDIVDDDGRTVADGAVGRTVISTRDPGLFLEYYGDPERTEAVRRGGVYDTGDLAYRDEEGYFFIAGRSDDCFKTRGLFLAPAEVENALQRHPAVAEAVVVPEPDPEIGNRVLGVVVPAAGCDPSAALAESLRQSLREELAHFKIPYRVEFAEALPKSPVGKILRNEVTAGRLA